MRKVVAYLVYSLDGVTESPERWVSDFDEDLMAHLKSLIASQDAVLLGRVTYEQWAAFWPGSDHQPFAGFINGTRKYVASTTLTELTWHNSMLLGGDAAAEIARLKRRDGADIGVHGSPTLVRSLLRDGLLDQLRLAVPPVIAGAGGRLFDGTDPIRPLELVESRRTGSGAMLLCYRPAPPETIGRPHT